MSLTNRTLISVFAFALFATACSGSDSDETSTTAPVATTSSSTTATSTTTSTTTTTTTMATTTTTEPEAGAVITIPAGSSSPLNGMAATDADLLDRRVIAVKVDNHPLARPQSGIQNADAVIELQVESGLTRFIALFHDNDSTYLGPIRSVRPTDSAVIRPLDGTLIISGGQQWIQELSASRGIRMLGEGTGTFRIGSRAAPHNLYADTTALRDRSDALNFDDSFGTPLYTVGDWVIPEDEASAITMTWSDRTEVTWRYEQAQYRRYIGTSTTASHDWIDSEGNREPISVDTLLVIVGDLYTAVPAAGVSGSGVPATEVTGSGAAYVFAAGRVWEGTWQRDAITDGFTLLDEEGNDAVVPPGTPWVTIYPSQGTLSWS